MPIPIEPDSAQIAYQQKWDQLMEKDGFIADLSSEEAQKSLLHTDSLSGTCWYPGYYEKWFFSGLGYRDHENYVGYDDCLEHICISVISNSPMSLDFPEKTCTRALVRTRWGFVGILVDTNHHQRSLSTVSKLIPKTSNKRHLLPEIIQKYVEQIKRAVGRNSPFPGKSRDSLASSRSSVSDIEYSIRRFHISKDSFVLEGGRIQKIADSLQLAPFVICRKLHDLERPTKSSCFEVDIIKMSSLESNASWKEFHKMLGELLNGTGDVKLDVKDITKKSKAGDISERKAIIGELLSLEKNYLHKIKLVEYGIASRLRINNIITKAELGKCIPKLKEIVQLHEELCSDLEVAVNAENPIGNVIRPFIPRMKMYAHYVNAYPIAKAEFAELRRTNASFDAFIKDQEKSDDFRASKLHVQDLMAEPVQRLPRYELLLKELVKKTSRDDPDYAVLRGVLAEFRAVCEYINKKKADEEAQLQLFAIKTAVDNFPDDIIKHTRLFNGSFDVSLFDPSGASKDQKPGKLYLFNDAIIVTRYKKSNSMSPVKSSNKGEVFEYFMELQHTDLISLKDRGLENGFQLEIEIPIKRDMTIRLGDDSSSFESLKKFNMSSQTLATDSSAYALSKGAQSKTITIAFQSSKTNEIISKFRAAVDKLRNRNFDDENALVYRKWDDANSEFITRVYENISRYSEASQKSKVSVLCIESGSLVPSDVHLTSDMCALVFIDRKMARVVVKGNDVSIRSNSRISTKSFPKCKETWWSEIRDFESVFFKKMKTLGEIIRFNDPEYHTSETERIRDRLKSIVDQHITKSVVAQVANLSAQALQYGRQRVQSVASKPSRSRRGSSASMADSSFGYDTTSGSIFQGSALEVAMFAAGSNPFATVKVTDKELKPSLFRRASLQLFQRPRSASTTPKKPKKTTRAPIFVMKIMCDYIESQLHDAERIYQIVGPADKTETLVQLVFTKTLCHETIKEYDAHTVADALKTWTRCEIEEFIPDCVVDGILKATAELEPEVIPKFLESNPDFIKNTAFNNLTSLDKMSALFNHLASVVDSADVHGTTAEILGQIWAPDVLSRYISTENVDKTRLVHIFTWLILNVDIWCDEQQRPTVTKSMDTIAIREDEFKIDKEKLLQRKSLDGLTAIPKKKDISSLPPPPSYKKQRNSLTSIDEGFCSYEVISPLKTGSTSDTADKIPKYPTTLKRSDSVRYNREETKWLQRKSTGSISSNKIPRKAVDYGKAEIEDDRETLYDE